MTSEAATRRVSFHPLAPTFTVEGAILDKWESLGAEHGALGYPVREAQPYRRLETTVMAFQRGRIVSHPQHGAHALTGTIERRWCDALGINGHLGWPTADARLERGLWTQAFTGGTLTDDPSRPDYAVDLRGEIARRGIAIRNQSPRPTCSVQVMVFLLEYHYSRLLGEDFAHLSVEFSNHFANVADDTRTDGHCFYSMEHGYDRYGILRERFWPYQKDWVYDYDAAARLVTGDMLADAARMLDGGLRLSGRFIKPLGGAPGLDEAAFAQLLQSLTAGVPVGVGRDHSMAAVGYRLDPDVPGGGMMLFRNSYGTTMDFLGYQAETFQHVRETVNDLYVYTIADQNTPKE